MSNDPSVYYDNNGNPRMARGYHRPIQGLSPNQCVPDESGNWGVQDDYQPRENHYYQNNVTQMAPRGTHHVAQPRNLPRKPRETGKQKLVRFLVVTTVVSVIVLGIAIIVSILSSNNWSPNVVVPVAQPNTASQVAASISCSSFQSGATGASGMVITAGTCSKDGVKYAVDTFASQDVRDAWLKAAEPLGVVPAWETSTSVIYKSVTS
jgi:hypothetical protein